MGANLFLVLEPQVRTGMERQKKTERQVLIAAQQIAFNNIFIND